MADPSVQERLREGIEAARRGDKLTARRLLQQVLIQERSNEAALMWMASVMDTVAERRAYLERALQVNPKNDRAREALARLGGMPREGSFEASSSAPRQTGPNPYLIAAGVVIVLMLLVVGVVLLSSAPPPLDQNIENTFAAAMRPTESPTPETPLPTATFFGIVVTLDPNAVELPPTFTPTTMPEPSATIAPTAAPPPIRDYEILYSDYQDANAQPSLFTAIGGEELLLETEGGFSDVALSPDGERIAFVRMFDSASETTTEETGDAAALPTSRPQLMVGLLDEINSAEPLTNMNGDSLTDPDWSPDGTQIVFASSEDGDADLYLISSSGGEPRRLTDNLTIDNAPAFSPDGSLIAYTSDVDTPGFTEIYTYALETGTITRLTDQPGNNYAPAWSPDGTQIVYVSDRQGDGDIYVMDATGSRSIQITPDDRSAEDRSPVWSPDGHWIFFASNRDSGNFRWYAASVQSGEIEPLTENNRNAQSLVFVSR